MIDESTPTMELDELHACGTRGFRLDLYKESAMLDLEKQTKMLQSYESRIQPWKWSLAFLQLNPENWGNLEKVIDSLPVPVVTDQHALLKGSSMLLEGVTDVMSQPGLSAVVSLLGTGNFWIKLSAPYRSSNQAPYYEDMKDLVQLLVEKNPRRVLWRSDWFVVSSIRLVPQDWRSS